MTVCRAAWCKVLNVSEKRVATISQSMTKGQVRNQYGHWGYIFEGHIGTGINFSLVGRGRIHVSSMGAIYIAP